MTLPARTLAPGKSPHPEVPILRRRIQEALEQACTYAQLAEAARQRAREMRDRLEILEHGRTLRAGNDSGHEQSE